VDAMAVESAQASLAKTDVADTSVPCSEAVDTSKNMPTSQVSALERTGRMPLLGHNSLACLPLTHPCILALF
jgi:hypothetical protein